MRFLHTADWHLGKVFHDKNLIEDQKHFLAQIIDELASGEKKGESYDAILVSGDIYDKKNPGSDATKVFSDFFTKVHSLFPSLEMFFIAGNHDDAVRLSYGKEIIESAKIHIAADLENCHKPFVLEKKIGDSGDSIEKCAIFSIPFVLKSKGQSEILTEVMEKIDEEIENENLESVNKIALAHLTTFNSSKSEYDNNVIGTIEDVPTTFFDRFDFTALGHIHKMQKVGKKCWYSGSPLAYYFDNLPKNSETDYLKGSFLKVEIDCTGKSLESEIKVSEIPVVPLHPVARICCSFEELLNKPKDFVEKHKNYFIEFQYTDSFPEENAVSKVKSLYPYALSFVKKEMPKENEEIANGLAERTKLFSKPNQSMEDFFEAFVDELFGESVDKDSDEFLDAKKELLEIAKEIEDSDIHE